MWVIDPRSQLPAPNRYSNHELNPRDYLTQSRSQITTDSQSPSLSWWQATIWDRGQFFFSFFLQIIVRQLQVCYYGVVPCLTRGRVCNLQLLLRPGLPSAVVLESECCETRDQIVLSQIRESSTLGGQFPYLFPQEQGSPVISPGIGSVIWTKLKLIYDRRSVH
jgi:hypothetical protein